MEKYYTPNMSEFNINFEYEYQENVDDKYVQEIGLPKYEEHFSDKDITMPVMYRVKYLERQDFENLGFEYIGSAEEFVDNFWLFGIYGLLMIQYNYETKKTIISIEDKDINNSVIVFIGTIKNKSFLKTIIKTIHIK